MSTSPWKLRKSRQVFPLTFPLITDPISTILGKRVKKVNERGGGCFTLARIRLTMWTVQERELKTAATSLRLKNPQAFPATQRPMKGKWNGKWREKSFDGLLFCESSYVGKQGPPFVGKLIYPTVPEWGWSKEDLGHLSFHLPAQQSPSGVKKVQKKSHFTTARVLFFLVSRNLIRSEICREKKGALKLPFDNFSKFRSWAGCKYF